MDFGPFIRYLQVERNFSTHTVTAYQADLIQFADFLKIQYESESIQDITHRQIRSWIVEMMENDMHPTSISRKVSALKSYFKYLMRTGELKTNPAFKVILPKKPRRLPKFVEKSSLDELLDQSHFADDYFGARDRMIIELFYFTGIRESELIGLKDGDIDVYNQQLKVTGKRNKQRLVPLTNVFVQQLKGFMERSDRKRLPDNDFLFSTDTGKKLYPKFVYNLVKGYLSIVASATQKSPHTLRHSFATHMLNNGADINAIKSILGHESLAATQVYTHNTIEKLKNIHKQAHPRG